MPNRNRKRRAARAKARKDSNSVESPPEQEGMASIADISLEEHNEETYESDLKTDESNTDLNNENIKTKEINTDVKIEEGKTDLKTEDTKPDRKTEESKIDFTTEKSKIDLNIEEIKTDLNIEEIKTDVKIEEIKTDLKIEDKAGLKFEDGKTDLKFEGGKTDLKIEEGKTDLKIEEGKTDLKIEEGKTDLKIEEGKTDLKTEEGKTDLINEDKTNLKMEDNKPDLKAKDAKPDLKAKDTKPDLKAADAKADLKTKKSKSNSKTKKDMKNNNPPPFIYNENKLSDQEILKKIEEANAAAGYEEFGPILKFRYDNGPDEKPTPIVLGQEDITFEQSGGVTKITLQEGTGDHYPGYGDRVVVEYDGYLLNGNDKTLFDSNRHLKEKTEFCLGRGEVIKGWDLGIATMKKGEKAYFVMQSEYAYGAKGYPPKVPPHATLLFEIDLLEWKLEDLTSKKDGGIRRKVLKKGEGTTNPNEGSLVKVHLLGTHNNRVFENCEKEFLLGEGICSNIPEGIESSLYKFKLKEESRIYLKDKYAFEKGCEKFGIPPMAPLIYEVTLLSFQKVKDVWEMNSDEKYEAAKEAKEKGVAFTKSMHYKVALRYFRRITTCLEKEPGVDPATVESRNAFLLSGYLNSALCCLKLKGYKEVIKFCDKALKMDPKNEKALYRRGEAKLLISECSSALEDFSTLLSIYPDNKAAVKLTAACQEKLKIQQLKDKNTYSKMFDRFVKQDQQRMRNMKTETGVWQEGSDEGEARQLSEAERLIEQNDSVLRAANIIELSNTVCEKL